MSWRQAVRQRALSSEGRRVVGVVSGSHFLNHMFLVLLPPIFGILVTEFDASLAELGLAVSVMSITSTAFQLPFGYLSDNYSRTLTLFIGLGSAAVGVFVIAIAGTFTVLLAGQALVGVGIGAHHPAHYPLMADATSEDNRAWAFSVHDTAGHLGYGAAPALIVTVSAIAGRTWRDVFMLVAVVSVVYALIAVVVLSRGVSKEVSAGGRSGDSTESTEKKPLGQRVRTQLRSLVQSPAVLALTLLALVASMSGWGLRSFSVVLLTDGYSHDLTTANTVLTLMFVGSAVATLISGLLTDRLSATTIIVPAYLALGVGAVVAGSLSIPPLLAALGIVFAASAQSMGNPPSNKLLDNLSERADLGVNFAIITVGVTLGGSIAPPLFGALIDHAGFWAAFYLIGGFGILAIAIVLAVVRVYDVGPAAPVEPAEAD
ncbi:MFS transporter [Halomicroarcula sp. GCM10025710]